jgi:cytoplasmic iron level regulating protein YaaA (DUF328/UPF0246 family)
MNDKIANSHNSLRPIILRAILNIYQNGNNEISAKMVKKECGIIDNTVSWNNKIPAICSGMRNTLECGGRIKGEDRDFNGFKIVFGNVNEKKIPNTNKTKLIKTYVNKEKSVQMIFKNSQNSIFITNCSSSKIFQNDLKDQPFKLESLSFHDKLGCHRKKLIDIITDPENGHFRKSRKNKKEIKLIEIKNEINICRTEKAHLVYSKGKFYNNFAACSKDWSNDTSRKIYIVSALFGLINANDYIPLYDLAMKDIIGQKKNYAQKFWKGKLDVLIGELNKEEVQIFNLLSNDYSKCFNEQSKKLMITPEINFTRSDSTSKRGKWLKSFLQEI